MYLAEHFFRNHCDSTHCYFLNIKFRQGYFSADVTKFSEQVPLKHLQEHVILLMSKSEHMLVTIVYKKDRRVVHQATTSDNEWYNEWKQVFQGMKTNESDFRFQNETIMHCKTTIYSATSFWKYTVEHLQKQPLEVFYKKATLSNFAIFTRKHLKACTFLKRDSNTSVFLCKFFKNT